MAILNLLKMTSRNRSLTYWTELTPLPQLLAQRQDHQDLERALFNIAKMAEDRGLAALAATEATSRSRSGSSSGSSESDVSPICKISPLVSISSTSSSPRPLTPKKRHRAEMEQEARRQEAIKAAERAKSEGEDMTPISRDKGRDVQDDQELSVKRISESEKQIPAETKLPSEAEPDTRPEDVKTEPTPKIADEKTILTKKRKAGDEEPQSTTPVKRRTTPKKSPAAKSPMPPKSPKRLPKAPATPPAVSAGGDGPPVPEGWRRIVTQRMQGESAGKFDVYIFSPSGKKFRSRPQLAAYLEETSSSLSIEDFSFKHKGSAATPARVKKVTPVKKEKKTPKEKTPRKKKTAAKVEEVKVTRKRGRPRKNSEGRSPARAAPKPKKGKQQRKVMKPPPDTGSKKASRAQQLQKLLVKINFQKPGDIREMSSDDSSEVSSEDDFDPGTTEEAGPDVSDVSLTPSPPSSKKVRRHSSPAV